MPNLFSQFNTRELSVFFWFGLLIIYAYCFDPKKFSQSFLNVLRSLKHMSIIIILVLTASYVFSCLYILNYFELWDFSMTKDTFYWFFGTALLTLFNINKLKEDKHFYRKIIFESIKVMVFIEYFINYKTYSFLAELIITFVVTVLLLTNAYVGNKEEYRDTKKFINFVTSLITICIIWSALVYLLANLSSVLTIATFKSLLLPILLTIMYIPFISSVTTYLLYDSIYSRINILFSDNKDLKQYIKSNIFRVCCLKLSYLNIFSKNYIYEFNEIKNHIDADNILKKFITENIHPK